MAQTFIENLTTNWTLIHENDGEINIGSFGNIPVAFYIGTVAATPATENYDILEAKKGRNAVERANVTLIAGERLEVRSLERAGAIVRGIKP